ncbi:MAG: ribosome biogenesis GTPase Der [Chloroflexi bacterium]|nr:ribosome biogenesis GTPase Der [Chloroflexota bacterium]
MAAPPQKATRNGRPLMSPSVKPIVAIVGRPNVGKSTLFNRLVGRPHAIVEDLPGTTRDRLYGECEWQGYTFIVVDTGGLELRQGKTATTTEPLATSSAAFLNEIRSQSELAMDEADVIVLLVDAREGITSADQDVAELLRRSEKPVILAANKADNEERRHQALEFYGLGLGTVWPISALHGTGTGDLLDEVVAQFADIPDVGPDEDEEEDENLAKIAIVGRPNVGKSSLLNAILGTERAIVSPVAGTTRDAIDTYLEWEDQPVLVIDTAGIRRRGKIEAGVERYSFMRAIKAIRRSDVVLLMVDAAQGVTAQDAHVAGYILEEDKSVVVLVNKWDLVVKDSYTFLEYTKKVRRQLRFLNHVPVLFISAQSRQRVDKVLPLALEVRQERMVRLSTSQVNNIMRSAMAQHAPPSKAGKRLHLYFATQSGVNPPSFLFFVNDPKLVHFSYQRFLENQIRAVHPFVGTPVRLEFKARDMEGD